MRKCTGRLSLLLVAFIVALAEPVSASTIDIEKMTTVKIEPAEISLSYPKSWTVVPRTAKALQARVRELAKSSPKLAELLAQAGSQTQPENLKFRVGDLASQVAGQHSRGLVRVYVHPASYFPSDIEDFTRSMDLVRQALGATMTTTTLKHDGRTAYRSDLIIAGRAGDATGSRLSRLQLRRSHGEVSVDVITPDDEDGARTTDTILASVHVH